MDPKVVERRSNAQHVLRDAQADIADLAELLQRIQAMLDSPTPQRFDPLGYVFKQLIRRDISKALSND